jgi:alpha-tubulin suppressor-like RCC1 family protein
MFVGGVYDGTTANTYDGLSITGGTSYGINTVNLPANILIRHAAFSPVLAKHGSAIAFNLTSRGYQILGWSGKSSALASSSTQTFLGSQTTVFHMNLLTKFLNDQGAVVPEKIYVQDSHSVLTTKNGKIFTWSYTPFAKVLGSDLSNTTIRQVDPDGVLNGKNIKQMSRAFGEGVPRQDGSLLDVTYALATDGSVWRWGGTASLRTPSQVPHSLGTSITKIVAGISVETVNNQYLPVDFAFALTTSGQLYAFGRCANYYPCYLPTQTDASQQFTLVSFFMATPQPSIVDLAVHSSGTSVGVLAVDSVGRLWSWGRSPGYASQDSSNTLQVNVTQLTGLSPAPFLTRVWAGQMFPYDYSSAYGSMGPSFYVQDNTGRVHAWGDNTLGQLCRGVSVAFSNALPINSTAMGSERVKEVITYLGASYFVTQEGSLFGCGRNDRGQLATLPFKACPPYYDPSCKPETPYAVLIAPTSTRQFDVDSFSVGDGLFLVRTSSGAIYSGGVSYGGAIVKRMDPSDSADPLKFPFGRRFSAFSVGSGGSITLAAPLEITPNPSLTISTVTTSVYFDGSGFASTTESVPEVTLSGGVPCVIQSRTARRITCLLTVDLNVRPPLVDGPLMATLRYAGESVGPVQIATVVPNPTVQSSAMPLSERATFLTIQGSGFGTDISQVFAVGCGPVTAVTSTSLTCRITSPISADLSPMKVRVIRAADPNLSSRYVADVAVATVVRGHEITGYAGIVPANAVKFTVVGRGFNASDDFTATVSVGDLTTSCVVSERFDSSFVCSFSPLNSNGLASVISVSIYQAGYNSTTEVGLLGSALESGRLSSSRSTFASNTRSIRIVGAGFGSATSFEVAVSLISGYADGKKRAQSTFGCTVTFRNDTVVDCRPEEALLPGPLVAEISTDVGVSLSLPLGQVVAAPSVDTAASFTKLATTANHLRIIGNGFASGNETDQNVVVFTNFPQKTCNIVAVSNTSLTCELVGLMFPSGLVVQASVSVYGGLAGQFPAAIVVNPPRVTVSSERISMGTTQVVIRGEGFASEQPSTTNSVSLQVDNGPSFPCFAIDAESNSTVITCTLSNSTVSALNVSGALTATVRAYGGSSEATVVGIVTEPVAPAPPISAVNIIAGGVDPGVVAGAVVAVVVVFVAVAVIIFVVLRRRMRLLKNIQGTTVDVPQEMASLFNIKSESLQIVRRLGEGSYGAVFLAKNKDGLMVAVKKLAGTMMSGTASDFFREAALMTGIPPHKNVVRTFGMCQEVNNFSLVMEYVPNGSLDSFATRTVFTPGSSWDPLAQYRIILGISRGMAHLAANGIVHRDLAARNVLLSARLEAKISDFGMSRVVGAESSGATKADVGPIKWMPPESIATRVYSEKSDVWSFGVVLYEMLCGTEPYMDQELLQIAVSVRDQGLTVLSLLPEAGSSGDFVPEYIRRLMEQCSQQEPTQRPSFQEIVQWLEQCAPYGYIELADDELAPADNNTNKKRKTEQPSYAPISV